MISNRPVAVLASLVPLCATMAQETHEGGAFAIRPLATDDYDVDGIRFDLETEQDRLHEWLSTVDRERLAREPLYINLFNWMEREQGGSMSPQLVWMPRKIFPSSRDDTAWDYSLAMSSSEDLVVPLFSQDEWNEGRRPLRAREFLVEFLPINLHDTHFNQSDLDLGSIEVVRDAVGLPAVVYKLNADRQEAFADWSERLIGKQAVIIVNGVVLSAPVFRSRIPGAGQIAGGFTEQEAATLAAGLRASAGTEDGGSVAAEAMIAATPDDPWIALAYAYRLLHGPDEQTRLEAAASLGRFGEQAKQAVPRLVRALGDENAPRGEVITALGMIGPGAEAAIPVLEKLSTEEDTQIAERAKAALRQIRGS